MMTFNKNSTLHDLCYIKTCFWYKNKLILTLDIIGYTYHHLDTSYEKYLPDDDNLNF